MKSQMYILGTQEGSYQPLYFPKGKQLIKKEQQEPKPHALCAYYQFSLGSFCVSMSWALEMQKTGMRTW